MARARVAMPLPMPSSTRPTTAVQSRVDGDDQARFLPRSSTKKAACARAQVAQKLPGDQARRAERPGICETPTRPRAKAANGGEWSRPRRNGIAARSRDRPRRRPRENPGREEPERGVRRAAPATLGIGATRRGASGAGARSDGPWRGTVSTARSGKDHSASRQPCASIERLAEGEEDEGGERRDEGHGGHRPAAFAGVGEPLGEHGEGGLVEDPPWREPMAIQIA